MAGPSDLELQAHVIMTAMESAHKVITEDFWQRGGRAWLKYHHPGGGPMWTLTITPHPMEADLGEAQCFQVREARDALATWDLARDPEAISRESVLADQVRALLAIIDAVMPACGEGNHGG